MPSIAIQTAQNRAVTELSFSFASMVDCGQFQYGSNADGLFRLNVGEQDAGADFTREFVLASSDYGVDNLKKMRSLYIGADCNNAFTVSVMGDDKVWRTYTPILRKQGLQEIKLPIGRDGYGSYWKIKISSTKQFRIDRISGNIIVRALGHRA